MADRRRAPLTIREEERRVLDLVRPAVARGVPVATALAAALDALRSGGANAVRDLAGARR